MIAPAALLVRLALVLVLASAAACERAPDRDPAPAPEPPKVHQRNALSPVYTIDRVYKSMQGPMSRWNTLLGDDMQTPELLWLTGFKTTIVKPNGMEPLSQDFMCHSNLDLNYKVQAELLGGATGAPRPGARIATISQGLADVDLPPGFGIPFPSVQPLFVTSQVLNHNLGPDALDPPLEVRHRVRLTWVRDAELAHPMRPLYAAGLSVMVALGDADAYFDTLTPAETEHGSSCAPGIAATKANAHLFTDRHQQRFTAHWVVKPGEEERRTLVTGMLGLAYDTTIHHIAVHLHPFAKSLTLRDLTTGTDLFVSYAKNAQGKVGLEAVDSYSSTEGIPVFRDHQYELVSVYDNTSGQDQDAMAVMYLFLADKEFDHDRALAGLGTLRQQLATMDESAHQRWFQKLMQSAASDQ